PLCQGRGSGSWNWPIVHSKWPLAPHQGEYTACLLVPGATSPPFFKVSLPIPLFYRVPWANSKFFSISCKVHPNQQIAATWNPPSLPFGIGSFWPPPPWFSRPWAFSSESSDGSP